MKRENAVVKSARSMSGEGATLRISATANGRKEEINEIPADKESFDVQLEYML